MSDSSAYDHWVSAGEPFTLAKPLAAVRDRLRGYGYTVYDKGDTRHLLADPPEDHTPYSATGWPQPSPFGWGFAIDIMPPPSGSGLPSLAQLGRQLVADRQAGLTGIAWLKYINWEPGDGSCHHDSWQPAFARRDSSDRGHIHLSARTDYQTSDVAAGYDPVARARSGAMADLDYSPNRVPALPGQRTAKLMTAEVWTWIHNGVGVYATKAAERGGLIARLDRIEDALTKPSTGPTAQDIAAALLADPAFLAAVKAPPAADVAAELIRRLGGSAPTT